LIVGASPVLLTDLACSSSFGVAFHTPCETLSTNPRCFIPIKAKWTTRLGFLLPRSVPRSFSDSAIRGTLHCCWSAIISAMRRTIFPVVSVFNGNRSCFVQSRFSWLRVVVKDSIRRLSSANSLSVCSWSAARTLNRFSRSLLMFRIIFGTTITPVLEISLQLFYQICQTGTSPSPSAHSEILDNELVWYGIV